MNGKISAERFYQEYANGLSIADKERFMEAMQLINRADVFATTKLGNIGFCWMGAWENGGSYTWMSKENIDYARAIYLKAGNLLKEILKQTDKGQRLIIIYLLSVTVYFARFFIWMLFVRL